MSAADDELSRDYWYTQIISLPQGPHVIELIRPLLSECHNSAQLPSGLEHLEHNLPVMCTPLGCD